MTSKSKQDLYFMMLYISVKFERNFCIRSKFTLCIEQKPQIGNLAKIYVKKGYNTVKCLRITPFNELDLYFMMLDSSVKFKWKWRIPSRVNDRKPNVWRRGRRRRRRNHDPYVSSLLRRRHNNNTYLYMENDRHKIYLHTVRTTIAGINA